jgi:AraC family transcriptional activator of tynA and feaB
LGAAEARTWSTAGLPEAEQFAFWHDVVWDAFVPVSLKRKQEGPFDGSVSARRVGPLSVCHITSPAQSVSRTPGDIARRSGDVFFLNLPLCDGTGATQDGRVADLAKGDFLIVDGARPFELEFRRPFEQVSLMLPHDLLAPYLAAPTEATAVRVTSASGVGGLVSAALRSLAFGSGSFDRHAARAVADQLAGLISLAVGTVQARPRSASRGLLLQSALDEVERSLGDPDLSPSLVARRIGVSTRYLHQLFADRGPSFGRWVLIRRLERCHRDLADPARAHWTIGDLACHHGFIDPSYFARAFKARYGLTPRERRKAIR